MSRRVSPQEKFRCTTIGKLPHVGAGNRTQVLQRHYVFLNAEPFLPRPWNPILNVAKTMTCYIYAAAGTETNNKATNHHPATRQEENLKDYGVADSQ